MWKVKIKSVHGWETLKETFETFTAAFKKAEELDIEASCGLSNTPIILDYEIVEE